MQDFEFVLVQYSLSRLKMPWIRVTRRCCQILHQIWIWSLWKK